MRHRLARSRESGETLIELIFAISIMAGAGLVFMTGLATAALSANLQTSSATATALVTSLGERAKEIPFKPCATVGQYDDELDVPPLSGPRAPVPPGFKVKVATVSYWTGTTYKALDAAGCAALDPSIQLQRLDLEVTGPRGVQRTLVVAKRGPLNIPSFSAHASVLPASPIFGDPAMALTDTVTLSDVNEPIGGTITFRLFSPHQVAGGVCTGDPDPAHTATVNANTLTAAPYAYTATAPAAKITEAGTYRWIASYSGDTTNQAATGVCDQSAQNIAVAPRMDIASEPTAPNGGDTVTARATLAGTKNPTGRMTFKLYGPDDTGCANPPVFSAVDVTVNGVAAPPGNPDGNQVLSGASPPLAAGAYRWSVTYAPSTPPPDRAYLAAATTCGGAVTVGKATPMLAAPTFDTPVAGGPISATTTVSGGDGPTGTVTFDLYGVSGCAGPVANAPSAAQPIATGGVSASDPFSPTTSGATYSWKATYSGDANNATATSSCSADVVVP